MAIEQLVNKALNQVDFKSHCIGNGSGSGGGSSIKLDVTYHKCGKKVHIKKDCKSKVTRYSGNPLNNSKNELLEWVTKKPVVSDTKDLATT